MSIRVLLLFVLCLGQPIYASDKCPEDIQIIQKDQVANCSGLLFSPDASKKADESINDAKYYKDLSDRLTKRQEYSMKEQNILDQRLKLYIDQSQLLAQQVIAKESEDKWQKFIYFGLGVFATGIAVYGVSKIDR